MVRGENLRSIYIFLFLQIVFFFFQVQSEERFVSAFALIPGAILEGELWRAFSYVFLVGRFFLGGVFIGFFFTLLILYFIGTPLEEEFGTAHFVTLFLISTLLPVPIALMTQPAGIIGSFFVYYTLMIIYGDRYGDAVIYLIVFPVKARWLAWFAVALLVLGVIGSPRVYVPLSAGVAAAWGYYRVFMAGGRRIRVPSGFQAARKAADRVSAESSAHDNLEQFRETKRIAEEGDAEEQQLRVEQLKERITPGVNICPPIDFKPEDEDGYCARCEGFNECSARWLRSRIESDDSEDSGVRSSGG
ncbi:MAG: rhomboid family intramembrane serine protease [Thermoanaerobaculia bacterium]|nr:rhomboid family intramembrane serine protease [Thermoanaerobaculia bacterium]